MTKDELTLYLKKLSDRHGNNPELQDELSNISSCLNSIVELQQTTCGDYETEKDAEYAFDSMVNRNYFVVEKEVPGRRLFDDKATDVDGQRVRIDRLLHPTSSAVGAGWKYGPIAVEIKKSKMAFGPILSQVIEYRQSVFLSRVLNNTRVLPTIFAVFPSQRITHDLQSLQHAQAVLSCHTIKDGLRFGLNGLTAVDMSTSGLRIGGFELTTKKGHRGREKK